MFSFLKTLFSPTLRALRRSLVELSKFKAVRYESVCDQIEKTRYAIMAMEGNAVDFSAHAKFLELHRDIARLAKEVQNLENRRRFLTEQVEKLEAESIVDSVN